MGAAVKKALALIIATLAFVLHAAPAYAGIETLIGSAIFATLLEAGVTTYAATVITTALEFLLPFAVAAGASLALAPNMPSVPKPGAAKETFTAADSPEMRAIGRVRVGGLIAFGNSYSNRRYRLYCHAKGPIDGFEAFYLGGREVITAGDGTVRSLPWRLDDFSYVELPTKVGTADEVAWPDLLADFPAMWTSNHRLRGIAQTQAKFFNPGLDDPLFLQLYQGGVPTLETEFRGEPMYDPRTNTTAWADNGILGALHLLLTLYTGLTVNDFDLTQVSSQADRADAVLIQKTGFPTTRCRGWGMFTSETPRGETMQAFLDSTGIEIVPRANGLKLGLQLIDDTPTSELTIEAKHIVGLTWRDGPEGVQRPNRCTLSYYSPERNYDKGEIDLSGIAWAKHQSEIDAYGEQKLDVVLPFCPNSSQAQHRARQMFALARAPSGVVRTNLVGLAAFGCRYVTFEFPDDLGEMLCKIGAPRVLDDEGAVEIPFQVWPTLSTWNPDTDEADAPDQLPDPSLGDALHTPASPSATVVVVTFPDGSRKTRVRYTVPTDADIVEAVYRPTNNGKPPTWRVMTETESVHSGLGAPATDIPAISYAYINTTIEGVECDFRLRTTNGFNGSTWSNVRRTVPVVVNTAPDEPEIKIVDNGTTVDVWVTAPTDLHVSFLRITGEEVNTDGSDTIDKAIGPGDQFKAATFTKPGAIGSDQVFTWTAQAFSSNETGGSVASASITIPHT